MAQDRQNSTRSRGGRNKLDPAKARSHRVQLYLTQEEHTQLLQDLEHSGYKSLSSYVAKKLFSKKQPTVNPILILQQIDHIGEEIHCIGSHLNQIARYANSLEVQKKTDPALLTQFDQHMKVYHQVRRKLISAYRSVVKSFN